MKTYEATYLENIIADSKELYLGEPGMKDESAFNTVLGMAWHPKGIDRNASLFPLALPRNDKECARAIKESLGDYVSYVPATKTWHIYDGQIHRPSTTQEVPSALATQFSDDYDALIDWLKSIASAGEVKTAVELEQTSKTVKDAHNNVTTELLTKEEAMKQAKAKSKGIFMSLIRDPAEVLEQHKLLGKSGGQGGLRSMLQHHLAVDYGTFLDDRRWLVVNNGVIDLEDFRKTREVTLLPHDPARRVYRKLNVDYVQGATHEHLDSFLSGSIEDAGQAHFLGKAVSVAMFGTAEGNRNKCIVTIQGAHNSGKSMLNEILKGIAPDFHAAPSTEAVTKKARSAAHARYDMRNARFVTFSEIRQELDQEFMLSYPGGDDYAVEAKYVQVQTVTPQGIMFFASNHPLNVDKADKAMSSRIAPINFPHTFYSPEEALLMGSEHIADDTLLKKILEQGSGFLNWMLESYLEYLSSGLDRTESMNRLLSSETDQQNSVLQFLKDAIEDESLRSEGPLPGLAFNVDEGTVVVAEDGTITYKRAASGWVTVSVMFGRYQDYCRDNLLPALGRKAFADEVEGIGFKRVKSNGFRFEGLVEGNQWANRI